MLYICAFLHVFPMSTGPEDSSLKHHKSNATLTSKYSVTNDRDTPTDEEAMNVDVCEVGMQNRPSSIPSSESCVPSQQSLLSKYHSKLVYK